ncbi:Aldo/keto reductase [Gloeopeniophorella convolvens]|nr:Aldo/keto reductase [Gloeopeniophorella convolvens]
MSQIPTRKIGNTDVPAIGYGAMGIATAYGTRGQPDDERLQILDAVYESGATHWDTADVYADSEVIIGKWFKRSGKRSEIFLATKFGFVRGSLEFRADPAYIREAIKASLERLGVDYIDLYYAHRADPKVPIEHTVAAMAELVKEGKVKYLGLSEVSAETLRRAHAVHPIAAVEVEYSAFTLDIEDEKIGLLKTARELGVAIVAYSPLGRGVLTGQYKGPEDFAENDFRRNIPKYSKENFPRILELADNLKRVGEAHNATAGQVALAWLLAQGDDIFTIPGTVKVKNLKENVDTAKVKLTPDEVAEVRRLAQEADSIPGARYPDGLVETLFTNTPPL